MKGNCDSEVDSMVCEFPIMSDISYLSVDDNDIYITHGHKYNKDNWDKENSILIYGHFHIPFIEKKGTNIFINPGSISLSKEGLESYIIYDNSTFKIYDIKDKLLLEQNIK